MHGLHLLMFSRTEDSLKPAGLKQVWGRDGLLLPKYGNKATLFQSSSQDIDREQVNVNTFSICISAASRKLWIFLFMVLLFLLLSTREY